ncbi:hypothetical protein [Frankia sp. EI5c]|uniref:hypothetical protein n=1 Tax=Frankia sp. EI5c TaxID=683316 RepID=UPI000FF87A52|nr:hypothetical protein [Frankia sp. EI5c]
MSVAAARAAGSIFGFRTDGLVLCVLLIDGAWLSARIIRARRSVRRAGAVRGAEPGTQPRSDLDQRHTS